jgi:hypothetical protein
MGSMGGFSFVPSLWFVAYIGAEAPGSRGATTAAYPRGT